MTIRYWGWYIKTGRDGRAYGDRHGVTANARSLDELRAIIDYHIADRDAWFAERGT